jgi:hypothetical protein
VPISTAQTAMDPLTLRLALLEAGVLHRRGMINEPREEGQKECVGEGG